MGEHTKQSEGGRNPLGGVPGAKARRPRLPIQAKLLLDDSLAANEHHPLARSAPEARAANRLRLIACVLARLAKSALGRHS